VNIIWNIFWERDKPTEERLGNLIGKIFTLVLTGWFIWAYWPAVAGQLGFH
jgi:hypothetical protein